MIRIAPEEQVRADVTASFGSLLYPVMELVVITGLCWMGIGWMDREHTFLDPGPMLRNALVGLWFILVLLRFVLPVIGARRRRIIVTDHRIIARDAGLSSKVESIPLSTVRHVQRRRKDITLSVAGLDHLVLLESVPKAKTVAASIEAGIVNPVIW
ncbi:hypothetical protein [Corynebacterium pseudopelargi]|uniref:Bacterial membrane flanked domain protein n=1 Tax=Corynebacterium pseudopelargi TaxID=2080757 RepID=A0A3G6J130_9CORY|nr:hypothetical protein [Corynebacterium pseudopelargi]AZA09844.1 hypothetical protein CPPEL_08705 [Corynebacterium pseudopelargi]